MTDQFERTRLLIGDRGLAVLQESSVIVFGVGGVGSFAVEALARAGVGKLTLVDHDVVTWSNLNRQLPALHSTVGQPKVEVLKRRIADINPRCVVTTYREFYEAGNRELFFQEKYDYVVDAIDKIKSKVDLIEQCVRRKIPIVSSMGAGNRLDPVGFRVADISETFSCPLAKAVRKELRQKGIEQGVKVVFSPKPCAPVVQRDASTERVPGSISFVPPVVGMILASVVVNDLLAGNQ
ncbi:MAG TPA: tRNA threonylcarbamoyladenosine dehydratase [Clostridia bacterium]|nr:tRNA threonylcarbamoyladenosine dehydratase [Clostridia bacterium]